MSIANKCLDSLFLKNLIIRTPQRFSVSHMTVMSDKVGYPEDSPIFKVNF